MSNKPGVMVYFDLMDTVKLLSDKDAGILFRAILQYGFDRTMPQLSGRLALLWPMLQMRIDTDDERYSLTARKRKHAAHVRWSKEHGQTPLSFNEWMAQADEDRPLPIGS